MRHIVGMGTQRIGNGRFERRINAAGARSWMLRDGAADDKETDALRGGTSNLAGRQSLSKEERQKNRRAEKYVKSQKKAVTDLIYDMVGKRPDSFVFDPSSFEEGHYVQGRFDVSTWAASGSVTINTPKGDIVLDYQTSREKAVRGLISVGNEDTTVALYEDKPIQSADDLSSALPEDLREGLASLNLQPGSVAREEKAEKKRIRAGKNFGRRSKRNVARSLGDTFGTKGKVDFSPESYGRRVWYEGMYQIDVKRLSGEAVVATPEGPATVAFEFGRKRESRGIVGLGVTTSAVFRHNGRVVKSMDDLRASLASETVRQ
jgi:hypothetical protein